MIQRLFDTGWNRFSRDGRIRTCGLHIPNVARYRATLHPESFAFSRKYSFFIDFRRAFNGPLQGKCIKKKSFFL
jgi:hypothetical protein